MKTIHESHTEPAHNFSGDLIAKMKAAPCSAHPKVFYENTNTVNEHLLHAILNRVGPAFPNALNHVSALYGRT